MKKHRVLLTIITILFTINVILTYKMLQNSNEYEQILKQKDRNYAILNTFVRKNHDKIDALLGQVKEKDLQLKTKQNEIHKLKKQLQNAMNNSESPMRQVSRGTIENNYKKIHMIATAYISMCYKCSGFTKVGINVRNTIEHNNMKIIAVDPNVIPLHSIVKIYTKDGTFYAYAGDTGGKIIGNHIDILIDTVDEQKALNFGVQDIIVQIVRNGEG